MWNEDEVLDELAMEVVAKVVGDSLEEGKRHIIVSIVLKEGVFPDTIIFVTFHIGSTS